MTVRSRLHQFFFWAGIVTAIGSFFISPPIMTVDLARERYDCKQQRRTATLTHGQLSEECQRYFGRSNLGMIVLAGGFVLLVIARRLKPNKAD